MHFFLFFTPFQSLGNITITSKNSSDLHSLRLEGSRIMILLEFTIFTTTTYVKRISTTTTVILIGHLTGPITAHAGTPTVIIIRYHSQSLGDIRTTDLHRSSSYEDEDTRVSSETPIRYISAAFKVRTSSDVFSTENKQTNKQNNICRL